MKGKRKREKEKGKKENSRERVTWSAVPVDIWQGMLGQRPRRGK